MKKLLPLIFMFLLLAGCAKQPVGGEGTDPVDPTPEENLITLTLTSGTPTKTIITPDGDEYVPSWRQFDRLRLYIRDAEVENPTNESAYLFQTKVPDGSLARFVGSVALTKSVLLHGFVPYESYVYNFKDRAKYPLADYPLSCKVVNVDPVQNPTLTSFDGHSDFLVMKPVVLPYEEESTLTEIEVQFARATAVARIVFVDNTSDHVLSGVKFDDITFSTASTQIAGNVTLNIDTGFDREKPYAEGVKSNSITASYVDGFEVNGTNTVLLNLIPGTFTDKITFTGRSENIIFSKTIPSATLSFTEGKYTPIKVKLDDYNVFYDMAGPDESVAEDIRLMQWNVLNAAYTSADYPAAAWDVRKVAFGPLFDDIDADIICTNECLKNNFHYIYWDHDGLFQSDGLLCNTYKYQRNGNNNDATSDNVIFYKNKYTKLSNGYFEVDDLHRHVIWVKLQSPSGKQFYVASTHIESATGTAGDETRTASVATILANLKEIAGEDATIFLLGDMNDNLYDDKHGVEALYTWFKDAREQAPIVHGNYSLNKFGAYSPDRKMNVDMIFYRNIVSCKKFQTVTKEYNNIRYPSDHYPVVADCKF